MQSQVSKVIISKIGQGGANIWARIPKVQVGRRYSVFT